MPVRKVVTRRSNHYRMFVPSLKNGCPTPGESMLEGALARMLEISGHVKSYEAQPAKESILVDGHTQSYTPDFMVRFADGTSGWIEVKPAGLLKTARNKKRMAAAREMFARARRRFWIITDEHLNAEPRKSNIEKILYHRRGSLTPVERDRLQSALLKAQPKTFSQLQRAVGEQDAWLLLGLGMVGVDLEQEINGQSTVYLTGGHKHANLFD